MDKETIARNQELLNKFRPKEYNTMSDFEKKVNAKSNERIAPGAKTTYRGLHEYDGGDSHDFDWGTMNIDGLDALKDLSEHDWDEFDQAMGKWGDKFGRDMEKWGKVFEKKMENLGKELEKRKVQKRIIRRKADSIRHIRESMKNEVKPKQA